MHNYASPVYINLPNIYKIVVCNTHAEKRKGVSSSRKEGAKLERDVVVFHDVKLLIHTKISSFNPFPPKLFWEFTIFTYLERGGGGRGGQHGRGGTRKR